MTKIVGHGVSVSLDGFVAGPHQSAEAPLGIGGERLHEWAFETRAMRELHGLEGGDTGPDNDWARLSLEAVGATIMGRNMFGPIRGSWTHPMWEGWWGDDPPFHHPVYVLTNYERPALSMKGGTSFHFVTGGPEEALRLARDAAGDLDVRVAGGASTLRQYLVRGLIDELHIAMVPWLLGEGEKLFEGLRDLPKQYECARFESTSRTIHLLLKRIRAT